MTSHPARCCCRPPHLPGSTHRLRARSTRRPMRRPCTPPACPARGTAHTAARSCPPGGWRPQSSLHRIEERKQHQVSLQTNTGSECRSECGRGEWHSTVCRNLFSILFCHSAVLTSIRDGGRGRLHHEGHRHRSAAPAWQYDWRRRARGWAGGRLRWRRAGRWWGWRRRCGWRRGGWRWRLRG